MSKKSSFLMSYVTEIVSCGLQLIFPRAWRSPLIHNWCRKNVKDLILGLDSQ